MGAGSALTGQTLRDTELGDSTGALVLALRNPDGTFMTNPPLHTQIVAGSVLIAIGTEPQLAALRRAAGSPAR